MTDELSEQDSSFDHRNSIYASNESIQEEIKNSHYGSNEAYSMKAFDEKKVKLTTHQDIMINSLQASKILEFNNKNYDSIEAEIELFQANEVFKKKNRISSRINGPIAINENFKRKLNHNISEANLVEKNE